MAFTIAVPPVVQLELKVVTSIDKSEGGEAIVICRLEEQPFASTTFTVYTPKLIAVKI